MFRSFAFSTLLSALATTAIANAPDDQLLALVSAELPGYVPNVDASKLSRAQLADIYSIMHSGKSGGDKNALIRSALGGRFSLRGLLFK